MGLEQGGLQISWNRVKQWTGFCLAEQVNLFQSETTRPKHITAQEWKNLWLPTNAMARGWLKG